MYRVQPSEHREGQRMDWEEGVSREASTWSPMQSRPYSQYLMSERGSLRTYSSGKLCSLGSWRQHAKLPGKVKVVGRCHCLAVMGQCSGAGHPLDGSAGLPSATF